MSPEPDFATLEELEPLSGPLAPPDLDISDAALEDDASITINKPPPPLGQTPAWDFGMRDFIGRGQGPLLVRGDAALRQWVEKCLQTHAGAHAVHPPGYGMERPITDLLGHPEAEAEVGDLETIIRDALTFHPRISDVTNFELAWHEDEELQMEIRFVVVRDEALPLGFEYMTRGGELVTLG